MLKYQKNKGFQLNVSALYGSFRVCNLMPEYSQVKRNFYEH